MPDTAQPVGYSGPPRDPDAVIRAALSDPDFVLQIISSYEEELRGIKGTPLKDIQAQERRRARSASS
jgi:hypothetical protein